MSSSEPGSGAAPSDAPADAGGPTSGALEFPDDSSPQVEPAASAGLVLTEPPSLVIDVEDLDAA